MDRRKKGIEIEEEGRMGWLGCLEKEKGYIDW